MEQLVAAAQLRKLFIVTNSFLECNSINSHKLECNDTQRQQKLARPLHKKSFPLRFSSVNVTKLQFPADLVTFTEEILDENLHVLCSDYLCAVFIFIKTGLYRSVFCTYSLGKLVLFVFLCFLCFLFFCLFVRVC